MDGTQVSVLVGVVTSIITLLTLIINIVNTNYKEARNRKWAQEDKEAIERTTRHKLKETEQAIKFQFDELKLLAEEIKSAGADRLKHIIAKVDENTEISKVAFKEANGINEKIKNLGLEFKRTPEQPQEVLVVNEEPIEVTEKHHEKHSRTKSNS